MVYRCKLTSINGEFRLGNSIHATLGLIQCIKRAQMCRIVVTYMVIRFRSRFIGFCVKFGDSASRCRQFYLIPLKGM